MIAKQKSFRDAGRSACGNRAHDGSPWHCRFRDGMVFFGAATNHQDATEMSQATIETNGPVREELCEIIIEDREDREVLFLDNAEVEQALADGHRDFLELLAENIGSSGWDILQAAYTNEIMVTINGAEVVRQDLVDGLGIAPTPKPV